MPEAEVEKLTAVIAKMARSKAIDPATESKLYEKVGSCYAMSYADAGWHHEIYNPGFESILYIYGRHVELGCFVIGVAADLCV